MHGFRKLLAIATITGAMALAPLHSADAAINATLNLKGSKTTSIKSAGKKSKSLGGGFDVLEFSYTIKSPRDTASGQATGKRQHSPFRVTIEFDTNIIAILIGLMQSGEKIDATLNFTSEKKKGGGKNDYLVYELKEVLVSSYQISSTTGGKDVIIVDLLPKSFEGKTADGTVFASSAATPST